jgi:hypothetical protein
MRLALLVLCALLISPLSAQSAVFKDGNRLLSECVDMSYGEAMCVGYIEAVVDMQACIPEGVTAQEILDTVIDYLKRNAKIRDHLATQLVGAALDEAFPCHKS